jgi:alpha-beta hydrolase superfamily lysophospholipase
MSVARRRGTGASLAAGFRSLAGLILVAGLVAPAPAQDYAREQRWADQIVPQLMTGEAVWLEQANGHRFLGLLTLPPGPSRGALIIAHGRGWHPDYELYGELRMRLAERGYTTLSIQLPILSGTAKLNDYFATYPDATDRFAVAAAWLRQRGHRHLAIVSHSLGATMANQYLLANDSLPIEAWVFIGIINGLESMTRIRVPVLDVFGSNDWEVTRAGAPERLKQISARAGSRQVMVDGADHFFAGREAELCDVIVGFLEQIRSRQGTRND